MTEEHYRVVFTDEADKQLKKLDKAVRRRILLAIAKLEGEPRPTGVKKLKGSSDRWRVRVGDWRIVYKIEDGQLVVLVVAVGHRSKVYKDT
ncbi:type II toxin-antitoxin system RelE family toxin [Glycomyces tenuis]|uniref:type II toxin-antitoxin system RelE family toxin n=1 Tax=Glycomyces tenuis TaxID=58116 RepID=UPI0004790BE1|nr:type II toxin-antitoxin system RelE/ParE family toxin [Glycomyces tenuis]